MRLDEPEAPSRYGLVAGGFLLFLAYPFALEYLGFLVATFLLMALFMRVGQWRNLPGVAAVSAIGTLALFYIFRGIVYVSLPLGRGPFHDCDRVGRRSARHALNGGWACSTSSRIWATAS